MSDHPCPACGARSCAPAFARAGRAYVRCSACGLLYVAPRPDAVEVDDFYRAGYWEDFVGSRGHPTLAERAESDRDYAVHALWRDVMPLGLTGRLLDVGASTGAYVAAAAAEGFDAEGIEPSDAARDLARRRYGIELHPGTLESAAPPGPFDVVVARDVLEHVADPRAFLQTVRAILAPDGHLVFETPTASSPGLRRDGSLWFLADPAMHLQLFTEVAAVRLLAAVGMRARAVYSPNEENMVVVAVPTGAVL